MPTKLADRKNVVLKPRLDPLKIELLGEKLKLKLFAKFRFLKPKPKEVRLISVYKHYEPFIVIGGKYAIDYCKRNVYPIKVDGAALQVDFFDRKSKPEPLSNHASNAHTLIKLDGEAYFHFENEAYFILDNMGHEIDPEQLSYAPSEERPAEKLSEARMMLEEVKISREEKIEFLKSRIAKKPPDVAEVIREIFEVNDRDIVYSPMYQLTFQNVKTGKKAIAKIDGITGKVISSKVIEAHSEKLPKSPAPSPTQEELVADEPESPAPSPTQEELVADEPKSPAPPPIMDSADDSYCLVVGDVKIPSETTMFETLVVKGRLKIGTDCRISGKVKASGDIMVGANTTIDGNVVSGGNVVVGPHAVIHGSIECAGDVETAEDVVIEGVLQSKSLAAPNRSEKDSGI